MATYLRKFNYSSEDYLNVSQSIYDFIEANKIESNNGVTYKINPGGPVDLTGGPVHGKYSLYSGSAGIGIYLLQLYDATGEARFLDEAKLVANEIIAKLPGREFYIDKYENALDSSLKVVGWHTGFYSGPVGAGIFLLSLYEKTDDEKYLDFAIKINDDLVSTATRTEDGIYFTGDLDLFSDGGYILYEVDLYKKTKDEKYLDIAREIASYIISKSVTSEKGNIYWFANELSQVGMPKGSIYPGLSHGTAGIAYALAVLFEVDRKEIQLETAKKAAEYLLEIADEVGEGLLVPYLYTFGNNKEWENKYYGGFCHGPSGTALLFYKLYEITREEVYFDVVKKLSQGIIELKAPELNSWGLWDSKCWCCGVPGLIEHFTWMYQITGDDKYLSYAKRSAARVIADSFVNSDSSRCFYGHWDRTDPRGVETYTGLYIGAAGAGAGLLRLYAVEKNIDITKIFEYTF